MQEERKNSIESKNNYLQSCCRDSGHNLAFSRHFGISKKAKILLLFDGSSFD
jgi:hypothetical protein